ncbi:unnamed protein product [Ostreobium quekettii]|uniref:Cationic amino acid transporter C-terminal domain-containing protein n=1 Tax=Ostreobium quekettii TaxID=121088 RepID=A0A8S1JCG5_9CHLO|nr:unnamed protein product [Ostreobium quekettii]
MALAITGMQSYKIIDIDAPYAVAFNSFGLKWAGEVVSIGAVTGIVTCLMVTLMGMARIFMVLGRERLLPQWMARVHSKYGTPLNATIVTGIVSGLPALFLNIDFLARMVSMGTLFVLCMVNVGVVWRRYFQPTTTASYKPVVCRLAVLIAASIVEGLALELGLSTWTWGASVGVWLLSAVSFWALPVAYSSTKFTLPVQPIIPALGILFTVHLMCSLGWEAYVRFLVWQVVGISAYFGYCMHHTPDAQYSEAKEPLLFGEGPSESSEGTAEFQEDDEAPL